MASLTNFTFTNLPVLGTTATVNPTNSNQTTSGQQIRLGGFSGLFFEGTAPNGNLRFITHPDRGPNGEPTNLLPNVPGNERPFALPSFQPELVRFELNPTTDSLTITQRIPLTTQNGTPLTGLPNLQAGANGTAYTDEVPIDLFGNRLPNDPFGADLEGIVIAPDGTFWLVDEYRPAIYHFSATGQLIDRLIPQGTAAAVNAVPGVFGTEVLPAVYAQRRANRGFEAVALEGNRLYAFIQSPIDNPDSAADTTSRGSRNLRIVELDITTNRVTGEYLYLLEDITGVGNALTDKIGDAVSLGNGRFLVAERDDLDSGLSNKLIFEIDLTRATNLNVSANLSQVPANRRLEQLSVAELGTSGISPVEKRLVTNAATLGYTGVDKLEGLALIDRDTIALLNDNDFGLAPARIPGNGTVPLDQNPTPIVLGILDLDTTPQGLDGSLPNGVASGDTTQTSTVLWTRSLVEGPVRFEYGTDPTFRRIIGVGSGTVTDTDRPLKVNVRGLTPDTTYFYRAINDNGALAVGQFTTSAPVGTQTGLRFGVSGDWRGELSPYPSISNAAGRDLEFFVLHGDTIYADFPSPALNVPQAQTLNEFRVKHSEVYSSRFGLNAFADLRASTSILATIDDHEVTNDFQGGGRTPDGLGFINDTPLYEAGLQAFQEYNPLGDRFYPPSNDARSSQERQLYRFNTYGSDGAVVVTDARSFRDPGLPNVTNPADPNQVGAFLAGSFNPNRTFLGRTQVEDLKRDLLAAENQGTTWKFVLIPEPIQNLGVLFAADRYEGYAAERTEILRFINDNDIDNVVFISADIHGTVVNNLTYQERPGGPQIPTNAFDISTGSVAFDAPFGPTVVDIAAATRLLTPDQLTAYNALPVRNDPDSTINDRDDFVKNLGNQQLIPFGYDPIGLNANLPNANGLITAELLQGDYYAVHTYGWTEFDIDPVTQRLTVTTYGIAPYTEEQLLDNPLEIAARTPAIVSQFAVTPQVL